MEDLLMKTGKDLLKQQIDAYGLSQVSDVFSAGVAALDNSLSRYRLVIDGVNFPLSVLCIQGYEHLSEPWRYEIQFTAQHGLTMQQILSEKATFTLLSDSRLSSAAGQLSQQLSSAFSVFGDMLEGGENPTLHGMITAFSQLSTSTDETRYSVTLSPRLALLDNTQNSAIFQHRTVPQVVEQVLRQHEMTGVDFRFELTENYPVKEYITQWQESDLSFIRRLLADSGIWFRFETHIKHHCDVVVFGDSEQQYQDGPTADYRQPSGNNDNGTESVWDMSVDRKTVPQSVLTQDYNYRHAQTGMKSEVNGAQKDKTTRGQYYVYGEHYRNKGETTHHANAQDGLIGQFNNILPTGLDETSGGANRCGGSLDGLSDNNGELLNSLNGSDNQVENISGDKLDSVGQGAWYARLRHQRFITEQITLRGKTTLSHLAPGQILTLSSSPIAEACSGILVVSTEVQGDRQRACITSFTGIPYDVLRPYRPTCLDWPIISGTLPARVTSPDNDTYSYIDVQGRYRVKMDFDLNDNWRKGEESLWMRLAKPYAGATYGIHFPLIDGTEVAIAFMGGNPDRPYIAHAMHDSHHEDVVTLANHKRNLIRTPANNKLRMDDERGKEHIKLATEYGKTQLNMGHLVNAGRKQRGEGFELRTDEWGAIRAAKGIQISTEPQAQAQGQQRDMSGIIKQLEDALMLARGLAGAAQAAEAVTSEPDKQQALQTTIDNLNASGLALYGQEGIAHLTPKSQQISAGENVMITSGQDVAVSAFKKFTLAAGDMLSLFAQKLGIKLIAASGRVQIQAQNDELELTSRKDMFVTSIDGKMVIQAGKELLLMSGGAGIRIGHGVVEIIAPERILHKSPVLEQPGGASVDQVMPSFQKGDFVRKFRLHVEGNPNQVIANRRFRLHRSDGTIEEGISDANGESPLLEMNELEQVRIEILETVRNV